MDTATINKIIDLHTRKFTADEIVRVLVVEASRTATVPAQRDLALSHGSPQRERKISDARRSRWYPLLDAMRARVVAQGTFEGDLRELAEKCPAELAATAREGETPNVRGLGYMAGEASRSGESIRGLRFTFLRHDVRARGPRESGARAVYRIEAA